MIQDIEAFLEELTFQSCFSVAKKDPRWIARHAARASAKADRYEREFSYLRLENEKLKLKLAEADEKIKILFNELNKNKKVKK